MPAETIGRCAFLLVEALEILVDGSGRKLKYFQMTRGIIRDIHRKS
ncbi:hypothetical protein [Acetobacterium sp.]